MSTGFTHNSRFIFVKKIYQILRYVEIFLRGIKTFLNLKIQEIHEGEQILSSRYEKLIFDLANGHFSRLSACLLSKFISCRRSRSNVFYKTVALKNFAKFTRINLE